MARFKIDKKEAVEGIIEENLFSQPFMVEMFGTEPEYELDSDISDDTDDGRDPIKKSHILVVIKAKTQTVDLVEAILNDFEIAMKNWLKQYALETYFDAIYTNEDEVTIAIDVPATEDAWSPEVYAAKGLEVDGSYIPRVILGAIDRLKNAQDLPAGVMQEMVDKVVDEIRGAGDTNLNESYVFVDFLEKLSDEVRKSIKGETIDYLKSHPEDNTGLGNTLSVVDTPVIQYGEDKIYADLDRQMKMIKLAVDARAKAIKKEVHDAIDAGTESPIRYVITSAIRPKPSRAEDGKDLGKTTASFYKWGKYEGEEEFDLKDITGMVQLGQYELEGFDIRDEDIDKTFYARELDIDDTNVEEEGYGVKRAYAVTAKARDGKDVKKNRVNELLDEVNDYSKINKKDIPKSFSDAASEKGLDDDEIQTKINKHLISVGYTYSNNEWIKKAADGIDLTDREETGIEKMLEPLQKTLDYFKGKVEEIDKSTILDRIVGTTYNIVRLAKAKYEKGDDGWGSDYLGQHGMPTKVNDVEDTANIEDFGNGLNKLLEEFRGYEKHLKALPDVNTQGKRYKVISAEEVKPNSDEWLLETSDGKKELFYFYKEDSELDYHFSAGDDNDGNLIYRNADDTREAVAKAHSMTGNPDNPEWVDLDFHIVEEIEKKAKDGKAVKELNEKVKEYVKHYLNGDMSVIFDQIGMDMPVKLEGDKYHQIMGDAEDTAIEYYRRHPSTMTDKFGSPFKFKDGTTTDDYAKHGKSLGAGEMEDVRNKLREGYNKSVSAGKEDGYPEYKANFENALFKKYAVLIADTGFDDAQIRSAYQKNEAVDNLVNYAGEKHQLTPIAAQGTAVEIKSPVKTKSVTAKSYLCVINDTRGKEIGSYQMSYNDDDYAKSFLSAIGVRLKPGDEMKIIENTEE